MTARMIPDRPPQTPRSERVTYLALQGLPDGWTVIHSVAWQAPRRDHQHDGEADFVLLHPDVGAVVLEVKGGGIQVQGKQWASIDHDGVAHPISDPVEQAKESKHALLRYLQDQGVKEGFLPMAHGVVFPDITSPPRLGPGAPSDIILTKPDLTDIEAAARRITAAFDMKPRAPIDIAPIVDALAPTTVVRHLLADDLAEARARLIQLTEEQMSVLGGLRRNRRALILGGAGTGKTVLAREKARRLAQDGAQVLLTCFNKPLADHLGATLSDCPQVTVATFHSYCRSEILRADMEFAPNPSQEWWDTEAATQLAVALDTTGHRVDAIVLDEGQDFAPDWFSALHLGLADRENGPFYVFADAHQAIYREDWQPPFDDTVFELDRNCRNTRPIAERVAAVFGDAAPGDGVPGLAPEFLIVENEEGTIAALPQLLNRLINLGKLAPKQVVVIAQSKALVDSLRGRTIAGTRLVAPGQDGITVETIHRFKGLEADAVIVLLDHIDKPRHRSLAYIGISRAKSHLTVIGSQEIRREIGWGDAA